MSNVQRVDNLVEIVRLVEPDFRTLAQAHGTSALDFAREASFAIQIIKSNSFLAGIAAGNPDSLKTAIINVAAIGLTLSPIHKLAYLIPRKKQVCLDVSYRGYVKLGTDCGAIKWAVAEVVCEKDRFEHQGFGLQPLHTFNPFGDRGEVVGAYCVAKTPDGDFLTTIMSSDDIKSIRDRSESFKAGDKSPWHTDRDEMIKKTVIRRAYKSWPMTDGRKRMDIAVEASNDFDAAPSVESAPIIAGPSPRLRLTEEIRAALVELNRPIEKYIAHLAKVNNRKIESLDDLTESEMRQGLVFLNTLPRPTKPKDAQNEDAG